MGRRLWWRRIARRGITAATKGDGGIDASAHQVEGGAGGDVQEAAILRAVVLRAAGEGVAAEIDMKIFQLDGDAAANSAPALQPIEVRDCAPAKQSGPP